VSYRAAVLNARLLDSSLEEAPPSRRDQLDRRIARFGIGNSEAMRRFADEGPADRAVVGLAREYYPVCLEFPLFLAAAISHVRDEKARMLLVANLYEEHGDLDPARTHPALFRKYIDALGLDPRELEKPADGSPGLRLASRFRTVCQQGPDTRAVAILYAFESLFSPACAMIARGLRRTELPEEGVDFFDVHAVADVSHADQLHASLLAACRSDEEWDIALDTAEEGARLLYELFDSVAATT
jgi:pyrroloquinoline-quinone synthase